MRRVLPPHTPFKGNVSDQCNEEEAARELRQGVSRHTSMTPG